MSDFIKYLWSFNRKERFFLVGKALDNPDFRLGTEFRQELGDRFALKVPSDTYVFVGMDYHLDWIYASAYLSRKGVDPSADHPNPCRLVSGNQEDMDLIVAFDAGETTNVIMLEAKAGTNWTKTQLDSKVKRLIAIFGEQGDRFLQLHPLFGQISPNPPSQKIVDSWPLWMRDSKRDPHHMKLIIPRGRKKVTRRDFREDYGGYFRLEPIGKQ